MDYKNTTLGKFLGKNRIKELEELEELKTNESFNDRKMLQKIEIDLEKQKMKPLPRPNSTVVGIRCLLRYNKDVIEHKTRLKNLKKTLRNFKKLQYQKEHLEAKLKHHERVRSQEKKIIIPGNIDLLMKKRAKKYQGFVKNMKKRIDFGYRWALNKNTTQKKKIFFGGKNQSSKKFKSLSVKVKNRRNMGRSFSKTKKKIFKICKSNPIVKREKVGKVYSQRIGARMNKPKKV